MPVEWRTQRNGSLRDTWYGRYEINGKLVVVNLGIKLTGTPPASRSIRDTGDAIFERSRATAMAKLDSVIQEARSKRDSAHLIERLYEMKTGEKLDSVKVADLANEWLKIPRNRAAKGKYAEGEQAALRRFVKFIQKHHPKIEEIGQVSRPVAREYLEKESDRGVTPRTWNGAMKLLRSTFRHLLPPGCLNPFADFPVRTLDTVFRKPYSPEEMKSILDIAKDDDFMRPIIVAGMCTAMRRGDCCLLKTKDVDLERRFITVKTAKTGQTVAIPIFPLLYDELKARSLDGGGYVFPEQAKMYLENPDGITWRVKKILATALGGGGAEADEPLPLKAAPKAEIQKLGADYIATISDREKRERFKAVFDCYMKGKRMGEVAAVTKVSKGSVSNYLNQIQVAVGRKVVRGRNIGLGMSAKLKADSHLLRVAREGGKRRASIRDFHSFRVTWVTLALTAGVALELVQKVTGHKTTDVVLKHYFQPGREAFRQALQSAMPNLLTHGQKSVKDEMFEILSQCTAASFERDKPRLMELVCRLG